MLWVISLIAIKKRGMLQADPWGSAVSMLKWGG